VELFSGGVLPALSFRRFRGREDEVPEEVEGLDPLIFLRELEALLRSLRVEVELAEEGRFGEEFLLVCFFG